MFHEVNLEVSLKAFQKTDDEFIKQTVKKMFDQWAPILQNRDRISVLLWASDGSNLLDFTGALDTPIEWNYFVGVANNPTIKENADKNIDLHKTNAHYQKEIPAVSHRTLKMITQAIKSESLSRYPHKRIWVGFPFDIGPEFAKSDFKYRRHPEICTGNGEGGKTFLNSYGLLNQDDYPYAGFPDGIPEKTPFGTFLGRQTKLYFEAIGFDYLWLSNGVGFSATSWNPTGEVFDGTNFHTEKFLEAEEKVFSFWQNFRKECPDVPIYTRGTNFSAGIDYATDAVNLQMLYQKDLNILPPPNSPWAAINDNYGLELMGHLTRNCELPGNEFLFRFYLHDPWWVNSPWFDRYNQSPHDIYLPMALSRIDKNGFVQPAEILNVFTLDNSFGEMPDSYATDVISHLMAAERHSPDGIAPFVWVYPFREFTSETKAEALSKILSGDLFICRAITNGFPLSQIVSSDAFIGHNLEQYERSVLITPVPKADSVLEETLLQYVKNGGKVLFYGTPKHAGNNFLAMFDMKLGTLPPECELSCTLASPDENRNGIEPDTLLWRSNVCSDTIAKENDLPVLWKKCENAIWYAAPTELESLHYDPHSCRGVDSPRSYLWGSELMRTILKNFGYHIGFSKPTPETKLPVMMLHKSNNATYFSVYTPDQTVSTSLKFPLGAPILDCFATELINGCSVYHFDRCTHKECRIFVEQSSGVVSVKEEPPVSIKYRRRISVCGLENATVRFFAEEYCKNDVTAVINAQPDRFYNELSFVGELISSKQYGTYYEARNITGTITFSMPYHN